VSPAVSSAETNASNALVALANQQQGQGNQLFTASFPGFQTAEDFYDSLASGDPYAVFNAIAPVTQQVDLATAAAKKNILQNGPPGGQTNLAIEQADVNRGAQVGNLATSAYLGAPNALAQLASQGVGESLSSTGQAISAQSAGAQAIGQLGSQQLQAQQINAEEKGQTFGALSSLAGGVFEGAGAAGGFGPLFGIGGGGGEGKG